ncbi:VanZ like family protein [Cyclonatronum proteinivorum]|uniref:VanZ like family protein n=2 Tax=Cyclonatronum proteinivorum TaxID=1457365 RepID=A0A345UHS9_9BACT|nr:VanZ like family protein [Cyclonatronum proteinivorum]
MILALYLTLFPGDMLVTAARWGDPKLGHIILFGGWTFLFGLTMIVFFKRPFFPLYAMLIIGILFGATVEMMQALMPYGRTGSLADIGYNTIGVSLAGLLLWLYRRLYIELPKAAKLTKNKSNG